MHNTAPAERYSVKAVFAARGTQTTSATTDSSRRRPLLSPAPYPREVTSSIKHPIRTDRLVLRRWREDDKEPFAALNADPVVMEHFPATLTREESDALVERAEAAIEERGFGWWAVEVDGEFIGFTGLSVPAFTAHFTPCVEIGWRLARSAWGHGYATEAARASLEYGFGTLGLTEVVSFTAVPNLRSQAVMRRLGMTRDPGEDFDHPVLPEGHPLRRHVLYRARRPAC
ncbi:GNAT family N-acetyltransferase [Microbispora triticiradicis]|nr:GNAT family N-acetyltransferase [Microbispora triticiradicis]